MNLIKEWINSNNKKNQRKKQNQNQLLPIKKQKIKINDI